MTGILVVNHFLRSEKFNLLHQRLENAAKKCNIKLDIKTNLQLATEKPNADFVLFWDKDIRLAKSIELEGIPVYNSSKAISLCDDKAQTYLELLHTVNQPKTLIAPMTYFENSDFSLFVDNAVNILGLPLIFKECFGSFGAEVHLCHTKEEIISHISSKPFILQEFVSASKGHDVRIEIVSGVCVAAMERQNPNDFRANITNGGTMKSYSPTNEEIETAIKATSKLGLLFGGVDILDGNILCEVNSNAHILNIEKCTGKDIAPLIFDAIGEKIK